MPQKGQTYEVQDRVGRPACFPLPLVGEWRGMGHNRVFRLCQPFEWHGKGMVVSVPAGTETDFASIPRIFHNILSPFGDYGWIAVIHDYLYRTGKVSRLMADAILREGMRESCVPLWQRVVVYLAVRAFGGWSYREKAGK